MVDRKKWREFAASFKSKMMWGAAPSHRNLWLGLAYKKTLYESPKRYVNNIYAFNDGSWLIFQTRFKTKNGKLRDIVLYDIRDVVRELAYFCRFQRQIGVGQKYELVWHMVCFIVDTVKIKDGVFPCNENNIRILGKIADSVLNTNISKCTLGNLKDTRMFCIRKEILEGKSKAEKTRIQAKGRRLSNYYRIYMKYDPTKSISQNAASCGVSVSTIKRYNRDRVEFEKLMADYERES